MAPSSDSPPYSNREVLRARTTPLDLTHPQTNYFLTFACNSTNDTYTPILVEDYGSAISFKIEKAN